MIELDKFQEIFNEGEMSTDPAELYLYGIDASPYRTKGAIVVKPSKTSQVSEVMRLCNDAGLPVFPRGSGTSVAGSPLPSENGVVIDLCDMDRILEMDEENFQILVEPGITLDKLNIHLGKYGYFFPPDPASGQSATIGGMIANNAGGPRTIKYGTTKDWVLGMEAVLPGGEVINIGTKTFKSVSTYDLTRLICGSEGTLAVITKARLKIRKLPEAFRTAIFLFDSLEKAGETIKLIRNAGVVPAAMEIMDRETVKTASTYAGIDLPDCEALLIIETDGFKESADRELDMAVEQALLLDPVEWRIASTQEERDQLWAARKSAFPSLARSAPTCSMEDLSVPIKEIATTLKKIQELPSRIEGAKIKVATFGHASDGNLHPTFLYDERIEEERQAFFTALNLLYEDIVLPIGGSITGEHGVGLIRKEYVAKECGEVELSLMQRVKAAFDPKNILNPDKGKPWGAEV